MKKKLQTNKIWESSELYIIYRAIYSLKHDYMVHHLLTRGAGIAQWLKCRTHDQNGEGSWMFASTVLVVGEQGWLSG